MNKKLYRWLADSDGRWLALQVAVIAAALGCLLMFFDVCNIYEM